MSGLLLRLAGPLQSWGERSAFLPERESAPFPTRSGLIGMFSAAQGLQRGADLSRYDELEFTVRADRPGTLLEDYHTAGGGQPPERTAATSGGKHKGAAVITRRHYLADAVFVVAVTGPARILTETAQALEQPHWSPYLGRRSCPPDEPFVLRSDVTDPVDELRNRVPLSTPLPRRPRDEATETLPVSFLWERLPEPRPRDAVALSLYDRPVTFAQHARRHDNRTLHRTTEHLPAALATPDNAPTCHRLIDYALGKEPTA
ncbi:type I-E CRISPR-associated protein Cas5/CasD [Streptomyces sp. PU-14G]|uniref:type I-E CRISPR-associated protein Cas5/CasD n=1 Tax=Streptomyces sp. PU-14G TaxID=2800808 RepID=UPI0034E0499A